MLRNLSTMYGFSNSIVKAYLVNDSKRITSPYFDVFIPSLMNGIEPNEKDKSEGVILDNCLNDNVNSFSSKIKIAGSIRAKSIHPYRFKHDGWIPEYKIETVTAESSTNDEMASSSSEGVTEMAANHTHMIKKAFKMISNAIKKITSKQLVATNSTEVDYQELNRIYIKKNHVLYGTFVGSDKLEFVIIAIDNVIPYYDEDTDNGSNDKI